MKYFLCGRGNIAVGSSNEWAELSTLGLNKGAVLTSFLELFFFSILRGSTETGLFEFTIDLDTIILSDFSVGQFVSVVSGLFSLKSAVAGEKVVSSRVC